MRQRAGVSDTLRGSVNFRRRRAGRAVRMGPSAQRVAWAFAAVSTSAQLAAQAPEAGRVVPVQVVSEADGTVLAGDLHRPGGDAQRAAVVLLGVAGPDDRDLSAGPIAPFGALARHLQSHGVAVLTLDDRGVGGSGGDWSRADYAMLVLDALSAVDHLARRPEVDAGRIGLLGLSEGSAIAMMAAAEATGRVAFLVLGSPPGLLGEEALRLQLVTMLANAGIEGDAAAHVHTTFDRFVSLARAAGSDSTARSEFERFLAGPGRTLVPPYRFVPSDPAGRAALFSGPWYRSQLDYDPATFLARVTVPTLVIGGALDPVLPPVEHHPSIAAAIASTDTRFEVVNGVNHLLLPATTGAPAEYSRIRASADPRVLALIVDWLEARGFLHRRREP